MILYKSDWAKYKSAIPDYSTGNKSFLVFVKTLQELGVKNCLFPLALHDPSLAGVDPHAKDLTVEQKERIAVEWYNNPWYYLREIARIDVAGIEGGVKVNANRGIIAQWWCLHNSFDIFMMQPRQTGKSVGMDLYHNNNLYMRRYKSKMLLLTKDTKLMVKNVKKLKALRDLLPHYLISPNKKDKDVEHMINYTELKNELNFIVAQGDPMSAINASRGHTVDFFHGDEIPFIKYVDTMIPSISSSMDEAIANAKRNGLIYGKIFTTTAGDLSLPHGRYAYNLYRNSLPWSDEMYDSESRDDIVKACKIATGLPEPRLSLTFSHTQLGISDEELWRRIKSVDSIEEDIDKDYFLIWGTGGVHSVIPADVLEKMSQSARQPNYIQFTELGYAVKWWIDKGDIDKVLERDHYILGVDTSNQINRDATAFQMINAYTLENVMSLTVKNASVVATARWLSQFMAKHKNVTLIIENKSSAQTFIDSLIDTLLVEGENPLTRIWNQVVDNPQIDMMSHARAKKGQFIPYHHLTTKLRRYFGFNTNQSTRHLLYSKVISAATTQSKNVMYDQDLTNQISMLKVDENGRLDHVSGGHDDNVIAWLLAHWMLRYGKNLSVYGIQPELVMRNVDLDGNEISEEEIISRQYVTELQDEIEDLVDELRNTTYVGMRQVLINKINRLNDELKRYGVEPETVSDLQLFVSKEKIKKRHRV